MHLLAALAETSETAAHHVLPGGLDLSAISDPWLQGLALALGTLILEDTTAIAAGLLAHDGTIPLLVAMLGTGIGIFVGDLGLYGLGALAARGASGTAWIRRRLPVTSLERMRAWFGSGGWRAIAIARVVSGLRLPVYLGAGFVGVGFGRFAAWTALAVALWTPIVVGGTALVGGSLIRAFERRFGSGWHNLVIALVLAIVLLHLLRVAWRRRRSIRLAAVRATRFEFAPTWVTYLGLLPFLARMSLRHGFARTLTAVNPCWPDGGVIGESKSVGLRLFPEDAVAPVLRLDPPAASEQPDHSAAHDAFIDDALARLAATGWTDSWRNPVVAKPDAGQRGVAVKVVRDEDRLRSILREVRTPWILQRFEPGACEVGLFLIRDAAGVMRLFSICEKRFPHAVGDGTSTLEELIRRDPRLRLQETVFLRRLASRLTEVIPAGERVRLANAGNHVQGCLFVDGERLRTPELEAWVMRIGADARGFHYGRLDVRFPDEVACLRGEGGRILDVNGVVSESTNMYDPSWGALRAWRLMRAHWGEAFRIGAANRRAGIAGMTLREVLRRRRVWRESAPLDALAD